MNDSITLPSGKEINVPSYIADALEAGERDFVKQYLITKGMAAEEDFGGAQAQQDAPQEQAQQSQQAEGRAQMVGGRLVVDSIPAEVRQQASAEGFALDASGKFVDPSTQKATKLYDAISGDPLVIGRDGVKLDKDKLTIDGNYTNIRKGADQMIGYLEANKDTLADAPVSYTSNMLQPEMVGDTERPGIFKSIVRDATGYSDYKSKLDVVLSNEFMKNIQQMKGLGALSNAEGQKVQATIASLQPGMSDEAIKDSLDDIYNSYNKMREISTFYEANGREPTADEFSGYKPKKLYDVAAPTKEQPKKENGNSSTWKTASNGYKYIIE